MKRNGLSSIKPGALVSLCKSPSPKKANSLKEEAFYGGKGHLDFVISAIKAFLYDIDQYLKSYLVILETSGFHLAYINNQNDVYCQTKYVCV